MKLLALTTLVLLPLGISAATHPAYDERVNVVEIHYAARRFGPENVDVHIGVPLTLRIVNDSRERIEFESFKLRREKVVEAGATLVLHLPPLKAGIYDFFDDFHADVPEGQIRAN